MTLRLRAVEPTDADYFFSIDNDESTWDDSDTVAPYSHHMLRQYAEQYDADPFSCGQLRLVAVLEDTPDRIVGILDIYEISALHSTAWFGIYVLPDMRRQGHALKLLSLSCQYAANRLRLNKMGARILDSNVASIRLFEKAGFTHCGTLPKWRFASGSWHDLKLYTYSLTPKQ